jgi:ligand-binding sensor domain-containing protein
MLDWALGGTHRGTAIHDIFQGQRGRVWFLIDDGLAWFDGKTWSAYQGVSWALAIDDSIFFTAGLEDAGGEIWLGLRGIGVRSFDRQTLTFKRYDQGSRRETASHGGSAEGPRIGSVFDIYEDRAGRIWFSTGPDGHIYLYDKKAHRWTTYYLPRLAQDESESPETGGQSDASYSITSVFQDRRGLVMIATNKGLVTFNESSNEWHLLTTSNSALPSNPINCLMEDQAGSIWIGLDKQLVVLQE